MLAFLPPPDDRAALVEGVGPLSAPGALPGAMVASGASFVLLASEGKPVVVAGPVGAGRAVAAGHEAFFAADPLADRNNSRFLTNALVWLGRKPKPRVGTLDLPGVRRVAGDTVTLKLSELKAGLAGIDVLTMTQGALDRDPAAQRTVVDWLEAGHGLLIAGPSWGWRQLNPAKSLRTDHAGNRMLLPFGIGFSDETADGAPAPTSDPLLQTDAALAALRRGEKSAVAMGTVARSLALSPPDAGLAAEIGRLADAEPKTTSALTAATPFSRLRAVLQDRSWREAAPETVRPIPFGAFPGAIDPRSRPTRRTVPVETSVPEWHGTGLYAAPGTVVIVTVPPEIVGKGFGVRVGAHTDELWHLDEWFRFPAVSRRWPLDGAVTKIASPFGGTIFIDVPEGRSGRIEVKIEGAVPAPRFVLGETTKEEWARQMAEPGGPWVELEGKKVILSVPRTACSNLTDPAPLMAFWDETFERCRTLYAAPPRPRPERYCVDRQISAGYMHSGYPIMTGSDVARTFVDLAKLRGKGATWGFFHELGHNFQEPAWTFDGTGEVTNNLFSLYGSETMNGTTPAEYGVAHPAMRPEERRKRLEAYLAKGARFEDWKADPFLALTMYAQLREAFGWEPFTKAFAAYREGNLRPNGELAKHDEWLRQMSKATGRDLGPFFQAWGVPTGEAARAALKSLPTWMPPDWP